MAARLLAVVAALGMIVGASVYRYGMPGGGDAGGGRGGGDAVAGAIVCARELGPVCDALEGATIEPAAATAERLAGAGGPAAAGITAWLAPGPWAAIVDAARGSRPPLFAEGQVLASSPLVLVTRRTSPITACAGGGGPTWRCLGDVAQDQNSRLAADPGSTPTGLLVRAAALGGFLDIPDYATNDLDEVPGASDWLTKLDRTLDRASGFGAGSLERYLATPASAQGFLTTGALAREAADSPTFAVDTPLPAGRVDVVLSFVVGAADRVDEDRVRDALEAAGWSAGPVAGDDGLPSPGVLYALQERVG